MKVYCAYQGRGTGKSSRVFTSRDKRERKFRAFEPEADVTICNVDTGEKKICSGERHVVRISLKYSSLAPDLFNAEKKKRADLHVDCSCKYSATDGTIAFKLLVVLADRVRHAS